MHHYSPEHNAHLRPLSDVMALPEGISDKGAYFDMDRMRLVYPHAYEHLTAFKDLSDKTKTTLLNTFEFSYLTRSVMNDDFDLFKELSDMVDNARMVAFGATGQFADVDFSLISCIADHVMLIQSEGFNPELKEAFFEIHEGILFPQA